MISVRIASFKSSSPSGEIMSFRAKSAFRFFFVFFPRGESSRERTRPAIQSKRRTKRSRVRGRKRITERKENILSSKENDALVSDIRNSTVPRATSKSQSGEDHFFSFRIIPNIF